ncbi:MAG TPA: toprim domain-containing protein [Candidatus Paceibacterota bacterium]|nr:toprim domain-containing protein [Candidatus Paceibacterota bacterium]
MNPIDKLTNLFSRLPGIGPRQAKRLVYFLLKSDNGFLLEFSENLRKLKENVLQCRSCYRFFSSHGAQNFICPLCSDENADSRMMLVLEKDVDLDNFRKSSVYDGKYFVLGGTLPFLEKNPEKRIRSEAFLKEVERRVQEEGLQEIIFALSANPEGENTADYLQKLAGDFANANGLKFSMLGRGLSTGTEIEYSDAETLANAFHNRT